MNLYDRIKPGKRRPMLASARMTGSTLMCILNYHRWAALLNRHYCKWMVCCIM